MFCHPGQKCATVWKLPFSFCCREKVYKVNSVCNCDVWLGTKCNRNQNTFSLKERWKNVTLKIIYIDVFAVLQSGLFLFKTEVTAVNWLSSFPIYLWEMVKPFCDQPGRLVHLLTSVWNDGMMMRLFLIWPVLCTTGPVDIFLGYTKVTRLDLKIWSPEIDIIFLFHIYWLSQYNTLFISKKGVQKCSFW